MASVKTDGGRALTGKNVGLLKLMDDKFKAEHPVHALIPLHCVLHQKSMCKDALITKHVIDPIVMFSILSEPGDLITCISGQRKHKQTKIARIRNRTFGCPLPQPCPLAEPGQGIEESVGAKRINRDVPGNERHSMRL